MLCDAQNKDSFEAKWPLIQPILIKLLNQEPIKKYEWFNLFSDVHTMCLWDESCVPKLRKELETNIVDFICSIQDQIKRHEDDQALLRAYIGAWSKFLDQSNYLPHPFSSMEATNAKSNSSMNSLSQRKTPESHVRKLMLDAWYSSIFSLIKQRLQTGVMKIVYSERIGEPFDSQLVVGIRESFVYLSSDPDDRLRIYKDNFEKAYIDSMIEFYNKYALQFITENGIINYLTYADSKLKEEEKRAQKYLETGKGSNSLELHRQACIEVLISKYQELIYAECNNLINNNDIKNLKYMFELMDRIPNVEPLLADLETYIVSEGLRVLRANFETITMDSEKYVEQLLELFNKFTNLVEDAFNGDPRFMTSRDKAFKSIVNDTSIFQMDLPGSTQKGKPESRCPELLANFCDMLLRRNQNKKLTEEDIKEKLSNVVTLLKYVQNKDVFMKYHKAHLTRRLILEISNDQEMEEQTVMMLKDIGMPPEYINKLSQMFKDIKVSEDINDKFKQVARNNLHNINLADIINIKILNAGAWSRTSDKIAVTLPPELEDYIPEVEKFYKNEHSGRKLTWHHLMSNGVINFNTKLGKFELEVTTFQMTVLFAWTNRASEKLSYESLKLATELPDNELRRTLWQLVAYQKLKHQVLCYSPQVKQSKDFDENTLFWINQDFCIVRNNKAQYRGKLNLIGRLQLSTEKNREEENQEIMFLRAERTKVIFNIFLKFFYKVFYI
ncbi:cullin-5 [Brachionus plicatilis]|uniref:Cullin-5 n=1 Tax=Brachionus plicatilis TaxID=10195 RepID=A0A3M7S1S7_BRAPC|nr:cullin-5 [Brachionus plicatilis]